MKFETLKFTYRSSYVYLNYIFFLNWKKKFLTKIGRGLKTLFQNCFKVAFDKKLNVN
jgi:hypothetical protein